MDGNNFNEDDKAKIIDFLNYIAKNATFTQDVKGALEFVKLLSHMQQVILPKVDGHILEVKKVHKPARKTRSKK